MKLGLFHEEIKKPNKTLIKSQFRFVLIHFKKLAFFFRVEYNIFISRSIVYSYNERSVFMAGKVYPDWVQEQRTTGTTVKRVGNNYYLYKHSSKRVPGKKNPVPVDTYIGKITPDGIERSSLKKVDVNVPEVVVKEYGFSRAVELLCPAGWKEPLGENWQEVLDFIIVCESPESYIPQIRKVPQQLEPHIQLGAQKSSLQRRMRKEYGVEMKDIRTFMTIYIVRIAGRSLLSVVSDAQKELLCKLNLKLEVD